jgi:hypothetical protein
LNKVKKKKPSNSKMYFKKINIKYSRCGRGPMGKKRGGEIRR